MKKFFALLLALAMVLSLAACGSASNESADPQGGDDAAETVTVGVCPLVQHPALDAATQGFVDALTAELGDAVAIDVQNASGEPTNCSTIVNGFVSADVDLIMANATPALTAAASATADIPVLGTSITAYDAALELDNFNGVVGGNISGTSDLADLKEQAAMILEWFPEAKTVGLLFCSAEANSRYQVDVVTAELTAAGKAAIVGEEGMLGGCGVATLSISYYDLGVTTGKMAAKILKGEADVSTMPIEYAPVTRMYSPAACEALGITPVEGYEAAE